MAGGQADHHGLDEEGLVVELGLVVRRPEEGGVDAPCPQLLRHKAEVQFPRNDGGVRVGATRRIGDSCRDRSPRGVEAERELPSRSARHTGRVDRVQRRQKCAPSPRVEHTTGSSQLHASCMPSQEPDSEIPL